jgi:hypothetical protein
MVIILYCVNNIRFIKLNLSLKQRTISITTKKRRYDITTKSGWSCSPCSSVRPFLSFFLKQLIYVALLLTMRLNSIPSKKHFRSYLGRPIVGKPFRLSPSIPRFSTKVKKNLFLGTVWISHCRSNLNLLAICLET